MERSVLVSWPLLLVDHNLTSTRAGLEEVFLRDPIQQFTIDLRGVGLILRDMLEPETALLHPGSTQLHRDQDWPDDVTVFVEFAHTATTCDEMIEV